MIKHQPDFLTLRDNEELGMTLRDHIALKVLPSVYSGMIDLFQEDTEFYEKCSDIACATYELADAMLQARCLQSEQN